MKWPPGRWQGLVLKEIKGSGAALTFTVSNPGAVQAQADTRGRAPGGGVMMTLSLDLGR